MEVSAVDQNLETQRCVKLYRREALKFQENGNLGPKKDLLFRFFHAEVFCRRRRRRNNC
jgi:hypothetical protein